MIEFEQHGGVWLLRMRAGENRFNAASVAALHAALDRIEDREGPLALVTTGEGKFFSNGLDLDWLSASGADAAGFMDEVHRLLGRILGFPAVTIAAVNGHAYAAGAMFASAHDFVVMREDRGYWCLPEVDLGLPLSGAMYAVVAAHLPQDVLRDALLTGRRYGGPEGVAAGIVDESVPEDSVIPRALELAGPLADKNRTVIAEHKRLMYGSAVAACAGSGHRPAPDRARR